MQRSRNGSVKGSTTSSGPPISHLLAKTKFRSSFGNVLGMNKGTVENTYELKIDPQHRFNKKQMSDLMHDEMQKALANITYTSLDAATLTKNLTNIIRKCVREKTETKRYKFAVIVHLSSAQANSVHICSRAVWSPESGDDFAEAVYSNATVFAVAMLFATYFE